MVLLRFAFCLHTPAVHITLQTMVIIPIDFRVTSRIIKVYRLLRRTSFSCYFPASFFYKFNLALQTPPTCREMYAFPSVNYLYYSHRCRGYFYFGPVPCEGDIFPYFRVGRRGAELIIIKRPAFTNGRGGTGLK